MEARHHGEPWTTHMDADLERMFIGERCDFDEMARRFGRTRGAITSRLRHMGYSEEVDMVLFGGEGLIRYIVLGYRDGRVSKLAASRGTTPDDAIEAALKMEEYWKRVGGVTNGFDSIVLLSIGDAQSVKGTPLNIQVETVTVNLKPRYERKPLYLQTKPRGC